MSQTEITVQIFEDIENVKNKLSSLSFDYIDTFSGNDSYFSILQPIEVNNSTYKTLMDSSIIVRSYSKASSNSQEAMVIHKQKTLDENGNTIGEVKTSVKIDNQANAVTLLKNAGLTNWLNLSQENHFYKKDEITIIIGTVAGLSGCFMEIEEYNSIKHLPEHEKFNTLKQFVLNLNFNIGTDFSCKKSLMLFNKNKV